MLVFCSFSFIAVVVAERLIGLGNMSTFHATVKYFQKTSLEAILSFDYAEWYQNGKF